MEISVSEETDSLEDSGALLSEDSSWLSLASEEELSLSSEADGSEAEGPDCTGPEVGTA